MGRPRTFDEAVSRHLNGEDFIPPDLGLTPVPKAKSTKAEIDPSAIADSAVEFIESQKEKGIQVTLPDAVDHIVNLDNIFNRLSASPT